MTQRSSIHRRLRNILALDDFEAVARRVLPRPIFGYIAGGAEDGVALRANRKAFERYQFLNRVLVDTSARSGGVELFGHRYAAPFGIAPMGITALTRYRGDEVLALSAQTQNVPAIMSAFSLIPLEDVAGKAPATWFQAYLPGEPEEISLLVDRVARAGFKTLVLTVDIPVGANRENNIRTGFNVPLRVTPRLIWDGLTRPGWTLNTFARTLAEGMPYFENMSAKRGMPIVSSTISRSRVGRDRLSWEHVGQIRRQWRGNLVIKGILRADDARRCRDHGADGIIMSNHGGRQLDTSASAMTTLRSVTQAVTDIPIMVDGGFRRGTDVLQAIALGARCVFVGRPFNYALAVAAGAGVRHAITLLKDEIERDMGMLGVAQLSDVNEELLVSTLV